MTKLKVKEYPELKRDTFSNPQHYEHTLLIYNSLGQIVTEIGEIKNGKLTRH